MLGVIRYLEADVPAFLRLAAHLRNLERKAGTSDSKHVGRARVVARDYLHYLTTYELLDYRDSLATFNDHCPAMMSWIEPEIRLREQS